MSQPLLSIDYVDEKTKNEIHLPITSFKRPTNEREYRKLEKLLDTLIDEIRDNEEHPLTIAMHIVGDNLEQYDNEHHPQIGENLSDIEKVQYLMQSNHLSQKDLSDIFGGQANVSKFLHGERTLSKRQIEGFKKTFSISADFFI